MLYLNLIIGPSCDAKTGNPVWKHAALDRDGIVAPGATLLLFVYQLYFAHPLQLVCGECYSGLDDVSTLNVFEILLLFYSKMNKQLTCSFICLFQSCVIVLILGSHSNLCYCIGIWVATVICIMILM